MKKDLKERLYKLHLFNIVHLDIKKDNICLSKISNKFVFIDFGFAKIIK